MRVKAASINNDVPRISIVRCTDQSASKPIIGLTTTIEIVRHMEISDKIVALFSEGMYLFMYELNIGIRTQKVNPNIMAVITSGR